MGKVARISQIPILLHGHAVNVPDLSCRLRIFSCSQNVLRSAPLHLASVFPGAPVCVDHVRSALVDSAGCTLNHLSIFVQLLDMSTHQQVSDRCEYLRIGWELLLCACV